ncbi:alpha/beta hydrolase [Stenotrophomonas rhizophila]|uniref:alpha/beta hydrolase n=1 Tax=Stenotrophomonas rhizophila TaxID=216778 RepID=UPI0011AA20FF|nr:alpha/beta hydrolase [Stenotrophomonas rhizophila]
MNTVPPAALHAVASEPRGSGPSRSEEFISGGEGELFIRSWRPSGPPRAVLAIVPGFNSHSGHYQWAAAQFTAMGLAVYAVDLRGRGKSSGPRFHVKHFDDYLADVQSLLDVARTREPGLPVFLLGHSAGGVIASAYTLAHQDELAGLICESYAFQVPAPAAVLSLVRWLSGPFPTLRVLKLPNKEFSRLSEVVKALNADPLIANEKQTALTVAQMLVGIDRLRRGFPTLRLPVLVMHGTADKVTVPAGSQVFQDNAGSADKTLLLYKDHAHDLLNDLGREEVIGDIQRWIDRHLAAGAANSVERSA